MNCEISSHLWRRLSSTEAELWHAQLGALLASADVLICSQCSHLKVTKRGEMSVISPSLNDLRDVRLKSSRPVGDTGTLQPGG